MRNIKVDNEDNIIFDIEKWHKQIINYQDVKLENAIDNLNIEIDYMENEDGFQESNKKDFEVSYTFSKQDPLQDYGHTKELKYLFEHGFKYILIDKKCNLYNQLSKNCGKWGKHRSVRSPELNIINYDYKKMALFIDENKYLYAYVGSCYAGNIHTYYFDYVGQINKQLKLF